MNNNNSTSNNKHIPNDRRFYEIGPEVLPLQCPLPEMSLWNSHPRVYLPIEETGTAKCPYCGCEYRLTKS